MRQKAETETLLQELATMREVAGVPGGWRSTPSPQAPTATTSPSNNRPVANPIKETNKVETIREAEGAAGSDGLNHYRLNEGPGRLVSSGRMSAVCDRSRADAHEETQTQT